MHPNLLSVSLTGLWISAPHDCVVTPHPHVTIQACFLSFAQDKDIIPSFMTSSFFFIADHGVQQPANRGMVSADKLEILSIATITNPHGSNFHFRYTSVMLHNIFARPVARLTNEAVIWYYQPKKFRRMVLLAGLCVIFLIIILLHRHHSSNSTPQWWEHKVIFYSHSHSWALSMS